MEELTLKEIAEFRILNSKSSNPLNFEIPEKLKNLIYKDHKSIENKLVEEIFRKLKFTHGGSIWVNARFKLLYRSLVITIGTRELANYSIPKEIASELENSPKGKEFDCPVKIHAILYKHFPGTREVRLSIENQDSLDNHFYRRNGKVKYTSAPSNFEKRFWGRWPFIDQEKYYKNLRKLNLPITYNVETLEKIREQLSNDPLNSPSDSHYRLLVELAIFIDYNNLGKNNYKKSFFRDVFSIYKYTEDKVPLLNTNDESLKYTFEEYSNYYKEIFIHKEDPIRRLARFVSENSTLEIISDRLKAILPFLPIILGFFTFIALLYILQITGWNSNFAFSIYSPLKDEILSQVILSASLGLIIVLYSLIIAKSYRIFLQRFMRVHWIIQPSLKSLFAKITILSSITALTALIFIFTYIRNFNEILYLAISLATLIISLLSTFCIIDSTGVIEISKKLYALLIIALLSINTLHTFFNSSKLYSQSCAYKVINGDVYKYRYFETGNWADKIEIALLPGSSEKWVDGTKIQSPTKITVTKSDIRSTVSCTDKFYTWDDAEKDFDRVQKSITNIKWLENLTKNKRDELIYYH